MENVKKIDPAVATGAVCLFIAVVVIFWGVNKLSLQEQNCSSIRANFANIPKLQSIPVSDPEYQHPLRSYYISTAYDVCTAGNYKNDFVNLCALRSAIRQGVRCLDFAVYTVGNQPVVACSSLSEYTVKESYNSIPFGEVLQTIVSNAFSASNCPTSQDPLLLHIRLMTQKKGTCNKMAGQLQNAFGSRLLSPRYSYQNQGRNAGLIPLQDLRGKVFIIVDQSNPVFLDTDLEEYVNLASNAPFMRLLRYTDGVLQCGDKDELLEYNKQNMSIVLPDKSIAIKNYPTPEARALGCQCSALAFQVKDAEVVYDLKTFESRSHAFILRPIEQRWNPQIIHKAPNPPASQSYDEREIKGIPFKLDKPLMT